MKLAPALLCSLLGFGLPARAEQAPQKTNLDCDHAEMWSIGAETHGICTGAVTLVGTNIKITCDRLEFLALGVGDKTATLPTLEKFKYMLATGHVVILQSDREATCGRAEVLPHEDKVILTENPVVIDRATEWTSTGEKITLLRGERRVIVEKSRVTGPAIRDLGYDQTPATTPLDGQAGPRPAK